MSGAYACLLGHRDGAGRMLVRRAANNPLTLALGLPAVLARAQVSTRATALSADGVAWAEFLADVPRFNGTARRLLVGGQRTNSIRNSRCEGVAAGSPGTLPTHWSASMPGGVTRNVIGSGTENGISYVEVEWVFTGTVTIQLNLDALAVPATAGLPLTLGAFVRALTFTAPGTVGLLIEGRNVGGNQLDSHSVFFTPTNAALGGQRYSSVRVQVANVTQATVALRLDATGPGTMRLRIGWPQAEIGAFASSPILPAVGAPAASTRGADMVSATLAGLGIAPGGACTVLWAGMIPQNAPSGADQMLMQIDNGTDTNRFRIRNLAGGATLVAGRVTGGTAADATSLGSMIAGTAFRAGITIDGAGRIAACMNGGAVQAVTGGPTSGLTTFRVGGNAGGTAPFFGEVAGLSVLPFTLPDTALPAAVLAF